MRVPLFGRLALVGSLVAAVLTATVATTGAAPAGAAPAPPNYGPGSLHPAGCNVGTEAKGTTAFARCYAEGLATSDGKLAQQQDDPLPTSLGPADIQSAYHLPDGGAGRTVAVVDAFGYTNAESDLAVFRAHYGLPPCTTADGCFTKVDQNGGTSYPAEDADWSIETALDLDAVSSACPGCHILLVQADDNSSPNLGTAVDTAADLGAVAISNSYGAPGEIPFESYYDHYYDHPGIAVTVSAGDFGNVQSYPATNPNVVAVGGTTLTRDSSARGWHESAWWSGGSGCSQYEPRPDYQQNVDTGCPNTKATADIAADADPASGLAVYNTLGQDGWAQWGGTSLASPLVAAMYALAGTPVPGTYPVTYPYRSGAQLNDVSDGSNGFCGNLLCNAVPGWDGPTGVGTPDGVSALTLGAFGHVAGTVVDGKRHQPVADAAVTLTGSTGYAFHAVTDDAGHYDVAAAAGSYRVLATKFGYGEQSLDDVAVTADGTLAADFSLPVLPTRGVSGTVTDGSGQGWPVYAKITIDGYPRGAVYTDPFTGRYHVDLPTGTTYTLHAAPVDMPGYSAGTTRVALVSGRTDVVADMHLTVDASSCTAAGYAYHYHGAGTGFEGWTAAQDGWQVTDDAASGKTWTFDDPAGKGNLTGGSGQFAIVDNWYFPVAHDDTSLVSPSADLTGQDAPVIGFDSYYYDYGFGVQDGDVYLSLDGGATWSDVWHAPDAFVQGHVEIPIPQAAGKSDVKVKFRFSGDFDNWWEIDNAFVGTRTCDPTGGGLIAGVVRDGNTGAPVVGATVTTSNASAVSQAAPDDAQVPDGFYWLYAGQAGATTLSATARNYGTSQGTVSAVARTVVRQDWSLAAGRLTIKPASVSAGVSSGDTRYQTLRLSNDGTRPLHLSLVEQSRGFTAAGGKHRSTAPGAALRKVSAAVSWKPLRAGAPQVAAQPQAAAAGAAWSDLPWYPTPVMDNLVAEQDGVVYSVAGFTDSGITAAGYAYHPDSKSWTRIADLPEPVESPVGGFVDGKLYAAGGWDVNGNPISATYAYDPRTDAWSRVADLPVPLAAAAGTSARGQLYVVAGCTTPACVPASTATYRYDPDTDAWTKLADYPQPVVLPGCAATGDGIVCAGGLTPLDTYPGQEPSAATYQYVAGSDAWTRVADMPYTDWGMGYTGADGTLQVVGGVANGSVTNQAAQFDPVTGTWSALPNANDAVYRGGAACGLYAIGGSLPSFSGIEPSPYAEQLATGDACISGSDVAWLSESSTDIAIPPGRTVTARITLDASGVSAPGEYDARLAVATDTPYPVAPVPVSMTVKR